MALRSCSGCAGSPSEVLSDHFDLLTSSDLDLRLTCGLVGGSPSDLGDHEARDLGGELQQV